MIEEKPAGPYLRTEPAAEYLGSTVSTLTKMRVNGTGPTYIKLGRIVLYAKTDLDEFVAGLKRQSTSDPATKTAPAPAAA